MAKILVADDDFEIADLVRVTLRSAGHEVTGVSDGQSAVDKVAEQSFDLLILDVMMPNLDGYHLASQIRSMNIRQPKIILLTSRDYDRDKPAVLGSGADVFVAKPFEVDELLGVVKNCLT